MKLFVTILGVMAISLTAGAEPNLYDQCKEAGVEQRSEPFGIVNSSRAMYVTSTGQSTGLMTARGEDVIILENPVGSNWMQIQRPNGTMGWVSKKSVDLCTLQNLRNKCEETQVEHKAERFGIVTSAGTMYVTSEGQSTGVMTVAGEDVIILDYPVDSNWMQIQRPDGTMGWVSKKSVERCN